MTSILTGWREQYDRMIRSYNRLLALAGDTTTPIDEAKDALFHFYVDAFHLRDWLLHDHVLSKGQKNKLELRFQAEKGSIYLALCSDLANGIKHFGLHNPGKTGDQTTGFTGEHKDQSLSLGVFETIAEFGGSPATASTELPVAESQYRWTVTSGSQTWDAVSLAREIVTEWKKWLDTRMLLK